MVESLVLVLKMTEKFRVKALFAAILLLAALMGCASGGAGKGDGPQVKYGGTMETTIRSTNGI